MIDKTLLDEETYKYLIVLLNKPANELTIDEIDFLRSRKAYLNDEELKIIEGEIKEKPIEETVIKTIRPIKIKRRRRFLR